MINTDDTQYFEDILNLPLQEGNDAGVATIREYLEKLLILLWWEQEDFNGKRPFGNSVWDWDLYYPLIKARYIKGCIDEEGYIESCDKDAGFELIKKVIQYIFSKKG